VPDMRLKIDLYRRAARLANVLEWEDLSAELADRFGPMPPEVERMLLLAKLRIWAHGWRIESVHLEEGYVVLRYADRRRIEELSRKSGKLRIVDDSSAYLPLPKGLIDSEAIIAIVQSLLQPI
jgi:transcription-repair coupling factor (superfamily II helicase)